LCANLTFKQQAKYQFMENYVCGAGAKKNSVYQPCHFYPASPSQQLGKLFMPHLSK